MTSREDDHLRAAHARSLRNRADLSKGGLCGCSYCLSVFDASEVERWIEGRTARCPRCGIDAVLSTHVAPIEPEFLRRMRRRYFERVVEWNPSDPWPPDDAPLRAAARRTPGARSSPAAAGRANLG